MKQPPSLKESENSLSEDFTTYNCENEDECTPGERGLEATKQIKELTQSGLNCSLIYGWKSSQSGQNRFKWVLFLGCKEADSCRESLSCADPTQTFPAPVKYRNSEEGIKLQQAAAFNLGRNTPFKSWNGKTA